MKTEDRIKILKICKDLNISVYIMSFNDKEFALEPYKIEIGKCLGILYKSLETF